MVVFVENSPSSLSLSPEVSKSVLQILDLSLRNDTLNECGVEATRVMTEVSKAAGPFLPFIPLAFFNLLEHWVIKGPIMVHFTRRSHVMM